MDPIAALPPRVGRVVVFEIVAEHAPRLDLRGPAKSLARTILGRPGDRRAIVARAVTRADPKYMFPDDDLRAFDRQPDA